MKFSIEQYAQALLQAVQETSPQSEDAVVENLIKLLKENNDLPKYEQIVKEFERLELERQGIKEVHATLAHEDAKQILEQANLLADAKVKLTTKIDPNILGGVVLTYDDIRIDASVKSQLEQLKSQLSK